MHTFTSVRAIILIILTIALTQPAKAQELTPYAYNLGAPSVTDYYIDPVQGSDDAAGTSPSTAWRTLQHAWNEIPSATPLTQGFRFNLMNGNYGNDELPNYWEQKQGTFDHPIILQPAEGQTGVKFVRDINMANVSYFYLVGIEITPAGGGDTFHCEACNHLLIRGCTLNGGSTSGGAHETLKVNQSQYVYIENNNISNADDNNIDFVAVQYGHIIGNKVHDASDWCAYVKGGSAQLRIESNVFSNCGTGGVTAGQGSGFQFMTSPWIHYEAYDIKIINNVIHDTEGAALGVNGGYNVLVAHNTAYRVGSRSHMLEVVFGERTCDGESEGASDSSCANYNTQGGWGSPDVKLSPDPIGNRNVFVLNNVLYNPAGFSSPQHLAIYGPRAASGDSNIPSPQNSDINLVIRGNSIWNGPVDTPIGIEDSAEGCRPGNPTCSLSQISSENFINSEEPSLRDPERGDFRPREGSPLLGLSPSSLTDFSGGDREASPLAPQGALANSFSRDFSGVERTPRILGAFGAADAALNPQPVGNISVPEDPSATGPTITNVRVKIRRKGKNITVNVSALISTGTTINSVAVEVRRRNGTSKQGILTLKGARYAGKVKGFKMPRAGRITVTITASDNGGTSTNQSNARAPEPPTP